MFKWSSLEFQSHEKNYDKSPGVSVEFLDTSLVCRIWVPKVALLNETMKL
jgi:hypothetical protein